MAPKDYLKLRGRTYYVQVSVPARLGKAAGGKSEFIKSLKTGDLNEANKRKHPYITAFKARIAALERQKAAAQAPAELAELYEKALSWRRTMEKYKGQVLFYEGGDPDKPYYDTQRMSGSVRFRMKQTSSLRNMVRRRASRSRRSPRAKGGCSTVRSKRGSARKQA